MNNSGRWLWFVFVFMMIGRRVEAIELWFPLEQRVAINCDFCGYNLRPGMCHGGIDYRAPQVENIHAAAAGTVSRIAIGRVNTRGMPSNQRSGDLAYGNYVKIRHEGGWLTIYAHLNTVAVQVGDHVEVGQLIGTTDNSGNSSGPHLHFEVRNPQNKPVDPYDNPADQTRCLGQNIPHTCGQNALWATCPPEPYPTCVATAERCNNLDDDCDGQTDEDWALLGQSCTVGQGNCRRTSQWICEPGQRGTVCDVTIDTTVPELCNSVDDNCDGQTDEDWWLLGQECTVGQGACERTAVWACEPGQGGIVCDVDAGRPELEICNNLDDDCDGFTDDDTDCSGEADCVSGSCRVRPGEGDSCTIQSCRTGLICHNYICVDPDSCPYTPCQECFSCSSGTCISSVGNGQFMGQRGCPCESQADCPRGDGWRSYCLGYWGVNYMPCDAESVRNGSMTNCRCN